MTRGQLVLRYGAIAMAAASWGTWPMILRRADAVGPMPMSTALTSTVVMAVITITTGAALGFERPRAPPTRRRAPMEWVGIGWLGIADALNFVLFFAAYRATSVAVAVSTHYLTPILVAIAAPLALRERASARTALAVAVSFGGLLVLLAPWNAGRGPDDILGAALGAASAFFYASNVLVNKRLARVFSPTELMCFHGMVATPLLALFVPAGAWTTIDPHAAAIIVAGAIGPGAIAGLLFVWGLRALPSSHVSTLTLLEPLVAVLAGAFVLRERLPPSALAGAALILAGSALVVSQRQLAEGRAPL